MSNLESTRPGWFLRAFGVGLILLAVGLTVLDLRIRAPWVALINIVTLVAGIVNFHLGTIRIRRAREHHEVMEAYREFMDARRRTP